MISKSIATLGLAACIAAVQQASTVHAFSCEPSQRAGRSLRSKLAATTFENEIGAQPPIGFFDPLGLLEEADDARFNRLRYVEIKHGRIAMLAVVGHMITAANVRLPGDIDLHGTSFASIPAGIEGLLQVPSLGLLQLFLFVGILELAVMKDVTGTGEFVGDFRNGFIDFGWDVFSPEEKERKRGVELNNGRAAMMGILAMMVHEMLPSHDPYMINALIGKPVEFNAGI
mmetsp:Transcript_4787/g.12561  ORF Transcript_4787/g.12561 Transcript_4787/m.12561 type:complete len:229 (-) Transcript_4787:240-926(-)|eukprot:CAMPEP_0198116054 /NCGR_PEP_ID=MMETSP1442-20131203/9422_1 /TAXON_ID= /ORGANISM="Craspedostauros australis, Strain CCMP3328" /LENGTH=228 /DNA_ID=CAMNT_0043773739 /DNA_START=73 /DNA_END=759 /DNA_ORIENTATION=+